MKTNKQNIRITIFAIVLIAVFNQSLFAQEQNDDIAVDTLAIEDDRINVPLQSVLMLALKNNLDITFAGLQPQIAATDIAREKSAYDTFFSSQYSKFRENKQVGNALMGSGTSPEIFQERFNLDVTLQKLFTLGTKTELKYSHQQSKTDVPFQGLNPEYIGEIVLSVTQPLLRDFGIEIGQSLIKIASLNHLISENEFRQRVMDILYQIESYYWNLSFRIEDLKAKEKSLKAAADLLRQFKIRIEVGTLAPIEIYQPEADVALRTEEVIIAKARVNGAEDNLKSALNLYEDEKFWNITIIPTDMPYTEQEPIDLKESIKTAIDNRPDFLQAKLNIKASNIQVKYTKNQTMPRIDLLGSLGTYGLAGRTQDTSGAFGGGGLFSRRSQTPTSPWDGHWDQVYDGLADKDYYSYMVGIKIEFPLENRLAKSQYSKAKVQAAQAITSLKNTENLIITDVRDAVRLVTTSKKVIETAKAVLRLAEQKLNAEEKKYKVGMSTTHDVLEFQEDLAQAESNLSFARTEHSKSLSNLLRVKGTLLDKKGLIL